LQGDLGFAIAQRAAFVANIGPGVNGNALFRFAAAEAAVQEATTFTIPGQPPITIAASNAGIHFQG
jgi:hypothetical protein